MIPEETLKKIKPGATVAVKDQYSTMKGIVIARKHGTEAGATFTVRSVIGGVGVEKVFPIHSPSIVNIEVSNSPKKVHRAKLYFLRTFSKKQARRKIGTAA